MSTFIFATERNATCLHVFFRSTILQAGHPKRRAAGDGMDAEMDDPEIMFEMSSSHHLGDCQCACDHVVYSPTTYTTCLQVGNCQSYLGYGVGVTRLLAILPAGIAGKSRFGIVAQLKRWFLENSLNRFFICYTTTEHVYKTLALKAIIQKEIYFFSIPMNFIWILMIFLINFVLTGPRNYFYKINLFTVIL